MTQKLENFRPPWPEVREGEMEIMGQIKAGVVCVTKFVAATSDKFQGYINYIDREASKRNSHYNDFNAFEKSNAYENYQAYMGNPEKSSELFTETDDYLVPEQKSQLRNVFKTAQNNGSVMWQTVLSFDNRWLEKNGLYDSENKVLDETKIRELTRDAIKRLTKCENISNTSKWCASIHYNTDNVHIHIAMVEPIPTRQKIYYNGKYQYRGKFKQSSIDYMKSSVVNNILNQSQDNIKINEILRKNILDKKKQRYILSDKKFAKKIERLYESLPENRKVWFYNSKEIEHLKPFIDEISKEYLNRYHTEELEELKTRLEEKETVYREAYGIGEKREYKYTDNKMKDLYTRLGNAILSDIKKYDKEVRTEYYRHLKSNSINGNRSFSHYRKKYGIGKLTAALHKTLNDEIYRHNKNLRAYEELKQKEIEELER